MKFEKIHRLAEICDWLQCSFIGNPDHVVTGMNEIHMVEHGDIVFVDHPKYYEKALQSAATTIIIDKEVPCPEGKALIISEKPFDSYNALAKHFRPIANSYPNKLTSTIHPEAIIFPGVYLGENIKIGAGTRIYPNAVIMDFSEIGENVVIGAGSVIGHDAFYYKKKPEGYDRMHSCGGVRIYDNVEIGALCTIDKGVSGWTTIGAGSKLDNQVHIGHDTQVGKNCLMAAGVGIAGCAHIEDDVTLWGQVGCASNVVVGKGAIVLAQSGISKSLEGGKTYFGSPCGEVRDKFKEMAALRMLPDYIKKS